MQVGLIQRYLGNKSALAQEIVDTIKLVAGPGELVVDAFSGSLAVSVSLRQAGFHVACNDISHFSWLFAYAFFSGSQAYAPNGRSLPASGRRQLWRNLADELIAPYDNRTPTSWRRTDIFDHYCEDGEKSAFLSSRGTGGHRRFFSADNARAIDRALSRIRMWSQTGVADQRTRCILSAMLLSAVEKVSNTQGTYHDFPREFIDARALKRIELEVPPDDLFLGLESKYIGREEDSLEFIHKVPPHRVIYLDPPYNFRQYTSYYFMLNLLSSYAEIADLDSFFSRIEYVRGQNMDKDFKSTFCSKGSFVPSLRRLIQLAKTDYVVMSYFDGRNHWGSFKSKENDTTGRQVLEEFFCSDLFEPKSMMFTPLARTNYQSYGGYKAKEVQEFLFVARKATQTSAVSRRGRGLWTGTALG
jgi:adenine-specific DNA methylase